MSIVAKNSATPRELIPAGTHLARCYQMIEIGTVKENILGKEKVLTKVRIGWELPEERRDFGKGEQPFVISKEYTLSMNEKSNLRKDLESWRGKGFTDKDAEGFDITKLLGVPCMLNIIHREAKNGNTYDNIAGIMPVPKSMKCPAQENKTFVLSYDAFDMNVFDSLPDFIKDKMKTSLEFAAIQQPNHRELSNQPEDLNNGIADDLPF
jgi:hypothetical protein